MAEPRAAGATPRDEEQAARRAEDAALLARIVAGDESAIAALHARYAGALYSLARQVTRSESTAQDVVQEVFIAVWRSAERFDPAKGSVSAWLFALARHKAIDAVRREMTIQKRTVEADLSFEEAPDDVDAETWRRFQGERIRDAIDRLPPAQKEAVELAFFAGLTHVEVAERLEIPLGTAKTRIRTALLRLRDLLGPSLSDGEDPRWRGVQGGSIA
jgi:RNA polymerase sigma-70 factor (ECF subfamily)